MPSFDSYNAKERTVKTKKKPATTFKAITGFCHLQLLSATEDGSMTTYPWRNTLELVGRAYTLAPTVKSSDRSWERGNST